MPCDSCKQLLFFKPLSDETFLCCLIYGETAHDIDIRTGVSPKVAKYKSGTTPCPVFKKGQSICATTRKKPFKVNAVRQEGEQILLARMRLTQIVG